MEKYSTYSSERCAMQTSRKPLSKSRASMRAVLGNGRGMVLSGADRDVFLAAIERKPKSIRRLVEALKRHRRWFG
jgi:hypothetical protein